MNKFKVGDRIRVYGFNSKDGPIACDRKIEDLEGDGLIRTEYDEYVHPKQCRKLVKRKRRECWVVYTSCDTVDPWRTAWATAEAAALNLPEAKHPRKYEIVHMIEVSKKK